jgi:hypothetical protein
MFLNGASIIRFQAIVATIFGVGCIAMKLFFIHRFGIIGIPWATIPAYLLLNAAPFVLYIPVLLRRLHQEVQLSEGCKNAAADHIAHT